MAATATPRQRTEAPKVFFHDVTSADGTVLRAWTNDPDLQIDGPTVLFCNGLGTSPWAVPRLLDQDCGVRVISWNHRGTGGSERPADPERAGIDAFVEDAIAVMDNAGLERAPVVGWSMGVNTAFELAATHPERVSGIFAFAGVPGDTFSSMLAPLWLPRPVARAVTVGLSRTMRLSGKVLTPISTRLPIGPKAVALLSHSGFMLPVDDPETTAHAVKEFLATPLDWYFHMALSTSSHARVSLSRISVPTAFVAATWDVLANARHMATAAERVDQATYDELRGSHFVAMERPEELHRLLLEFLDRVD